MLLTIGIPTYNRAENVSRLLHDLLSQGAAELVEILVVDDGGTDGTYATLSEDPALTGRVRILRNEANLGYARTFARIFAECSTEYVMLVADDDHVLVENLPALLSHLAERRPVFLSPQFLKGSTVYRGKPTTVPIAPGEFLACSAHAPGLVYRVEDSRAGLEEVVAGADADEPDAAIYPQVVLVANLLIAGGVCEWLAVPTAAEGEARPSGIRDAGGSAYWSVESRWRQLRSFDSLLSAHAAKDASGAAAEMLAVQRQRVVPDDVDSDPPRGSRARCGVRRCGGGPLSERRSLGAQVLPDRRVGGSAAQAPPPRVTSPPLGGSRGSGFDEASDITYA